MSATVSPLRDDQPVTIRSFVADASSGMLGVTDGEFLVQMFPDGRVTIAYRAKPWFSWGPPIMTEDRS